MKPYNDTIETLRLFGLASFRNEQIKPIEALRKCKNVFVNAPTSSGKSLIYQLPAVLHQEHAGANDPTGLHEAAQTRPCLSNRCR